MIANQNTEGIVALHFGPAPLDFLSKAAKLCGKDAVVDPQVAKMAGAVIAAGTPAALEALRARLTAGSVDHQRQRAAGVSLPPGAINWLGAGERGVSSETIFSVTTGFEVADGSHDHPHDPDDFRRCELLLDAVPELRERMPEMASEGPVWKALVDRWQDIVSTFDAECPGWRTSKNWIASKTYELMRSIIASANKT